MKDKIRKLLEDMPAKRASDIHIRAGSPIHYRIDGDLAEASEGVLGPEQSKETVYGFLNAEQIGKFEETKELDFAFSLEGTGRFRGNAFLQKGNVGCAIRLIPDKIRSIAECGLPVHVVEKFCRCERGLVLITGATGSGKSTTLAAMIDDINKHRKCHIVTVEDPIEYVHESKMAIVDQRELYADTHSFAGALRHVLRQDPDVIMIGELRDLETIQAALTIADTGHLVLGTLHTSDSTQSINRIVDVFPAGQQAQIRSQLSLVLLGILSQQLVPKKGEPGMVLATEVLVANSAIRSLIRDSKEYQIYSIVQTSQKIGMKTMDQDLANLQLAGKIAYDDALSKSANPEALAKLIEQGGGIIKGAGQYPA